MNPYINYFIYSKASSIHGWGVFTKGFLPKGTIIERSAIITLPVDPHNPVSLLDDYRFGWPQNKKWNEIVIGLGYASLYNHSVEPNVEWDSDTDSRLLIFKTIRDIEPEEELFIFYGDNYSWNNIQIQ